MNSGRVRILGLFHRTGAHAEQRVGGAEPEDAGEQRHEAEQRPVARVAFEYEEQREHDEPDDDAQRAIDTTNVRVHDLSSTWVFASAGPGPRLKRNARAGPPGASVT